MARVGDAAERLRAALGPSPGVVPHSKALEVAARVFGAGASWHEACSSDEGGTPPFHRIVVTEVGAGMSPGFDVWGRDGPWFALGALAGCLQVPDGWGAAAWNQKAKGLWGAAGPALSDLARSEGRAVTPGDCLRASTWEGIGVLRLDERVSEESRTVLGMWARPWHSAYGKDSGGFALVSSAWAEAIGWLDGLGGRPGSWEDEIVSGKVTVERGNSFSAALARALCEKNGLGAVCRRDASVQTACRFPRAR